MDIKKELKKLNRKELLEIILEQKYRIEDLETTLEKTKQELQSKKISLKDTGTLAEAALKLSGIFKNADEAINIYKLNIKESLEETSNKKIAELEKQIKELRSNQIKESSYNIKDEKNNQSKHKEKIIISVSNKERTKSKGKK